MPDNDDKPPPQPTLIPKSIIHTCSVCSTNIEVPLVNGRLPASTQCPKCGTVYSFQATQSQQNQPHQWTPEEVESLIKLVDALASKYIIFKEKEAEADNRTLRVVTKHSLILTVVLATFLGGIVGLMSILTYVGRVSGDALLFLVGTVTGYILLFIQRLTKSVLGEGREEEDE